MMVLRKALLALHSTALFWHAISFTQYMDQRIDKNNNPENAMNSEEKVHSNDRKMKQDFPGYPHNPASEDVLDEQKNWRTDFSNESDTTATGSESLKGDRPTAEENELKNGNDRGLNFHEVDPEKNYNNGGQDTGRKENK